MFALTAASHGNVAAVLDPPPKRQRRVHTMQVVAARVHYHLFWPLWFSAALHDAMLKRQGWLLEGGGAIAPVVAQRGLHVCKRIDTASTAGVAAVVEP
jgi:hypothetical protein